MTRRQPWVDDSPLEDRLATMTDVPLGRNHPRVHALWLSSRPMIEVGSVVAAVSVACSPRYFDSSVEVLGVGRIR